MQHRHVDRAPVTDHAWVYSSCACGARRTDGPNWNFLSSRPRDGWPQAPGCWTDEPAAGWPATRWAAGTPWPARGWPAHPGYPQRRGLRRLLVTTLNRLAA